MDTKKLLVYWKESLKLFEPANLSLYLLGCLNTVKLSASIILRYFWWVFFILVILHAGHLPKIYGGLPNLGTNITVLLHIIMLFGYVMTMRPSIEPKEAAYYLAYVPGIWGVGLTYLLVGPYLLPLAALVLLFFFDTALGLKDYALSWIRAGKLLFYFLPAVGIIALAKLLLNICWYWFAYRMDAFVPGLSIPLLAVIHMINYASLTVFYLRVKHNHFNLIFE